MRVEPFVSLPVAVGVLLDDIRLGAHNLSK